jgi:hypothetical protein
MQRTHKKNHLQLSLLVVVFVIPIIVSVLLYYYHASFRLKKLNHGTLLSAPIDANYLYSASKEKKWRVIYVTDQGCDAACQTINHNLHQMQIALNKDSQRVTIVLLQGQTPSLQKLKNSLSLQENPQFVVSNKIYLVDPIGNLFMYYPSTANLMDVLKDLKRVLEVSQIG